MGMFGMPHKAGLDCILKPNPCLVQTKSSLVWLNSLHKLYYTYPHPPLCLSEFDQNLA